MEANICKKVSKKTGKEYYCVEIKITDNYNKLVFLDEAESALVKVAYDY